MTEYIKPGRYKTRAGRDAVVACDLREHGFTGLYPVIGFCFGKTDKRETWEPSGAYVDGGTESDDDILNIEDGPLPDRPKVWVATHYANGHRLTQAYTTCDAETAQDWRDVLWEVAEHDMPEEWL